MNVYQISIEESTISASHYIDTDEYEQIYLLLAKTMPSGDAQVIANKILDILKIKTRIAIAGVSE